MFRLIVTYALIDILGEGESNTILALSAALFILPFLLFTYPSGQLSDRFSKKRVIMWTLWAELIFMFLGFWAIWMRDEFFSYFALFLIAFQSSVFNPAKFAILPEIKSRDELSHANGLLTLATYLSIILGTFLATVICDFTDRNYLLVVMICIVFSVLAIFTGLAIENTPVKNPERKINCFFLFDMFRTLRIASKYPHLLLAIFASSYFLFTAAYTQLNLIPFGMQSLGITDVQTGYIYLAAAFGVGMGSLLVGILSGKTVELGLSLWGAFGTGISYLLLYVAQYQLPISCLLFFSVGMHGGLYVVPLDAFIQFASPEKYRGSIVGAATLMSFIAVLFSAAAIALMGNVLDWRAATGYLTIGIMTIGVSFWILFYLLEYITRLFAVLAVRFFFTLHNGQTPEQSVIIASERKTTILFSLVYSFQKIVFIQWVDSPPGRLQIAWQKIFNTLPLSLDAQGHLPINQQQLLQKRCQQGYSFCLFRQDPGLKHLSLSFPIAIKRVEAITHLPLIRAQVTSINNTYSSFFHFLRILHPRISLSFHELKNQQNIS